jgi:hypothetical protein
MQVCLSVDTVWELKHVGLLSVEQPKLNAKQVVWNGKGRRLCFGSYRLESQLEHNLSFLIFIVFFFGHVTAQARLPHP